MEINRLDMSCNNQIKSGKNHHSSFTTKSKTTKYKTIIFCLWKL